MQTYIRSVLCVLALSAHAMAAEDLHAVPPELKAWVPWVMQGQEEALCPKAVVGDARTCAWPGALELDIDGKRARFSLAYDVFGAEQTVQLPGSERTWPKNVKDGMKPALMVPGDASHPSAKLAVGRHVLRGEVTLENAGELQVPENIGIVTVRQAGKSLAVRRDDDGLARWGAEESGVQDDSLSVRVFRRFHDGVPGELETRLLMDVSGKAREVLLGRALPDAFSPIRLQAGVPASIDGEGRLRVQVRPGTHSVTLSAVSRAEVSELLRPKSDGNWPAREVWSFDGVPSHRVVVIGGSSAIDPVQAGVPAEWRSLSAYPMSDGVTLKLSVLPADAEQGTLWALNRRLWQDLDGGGYTFQDQLTGTVTSPERVSINAPYQLREMRVSGASEWLVLAPSGGPDAALPSVRVSQGASDASLTAIGRIDGHTNELAASAWNARVRKVNTTLTLRPGSTVFHVGGVDHVSDTWVQRWDLMRAFLLTILCAVASRFSGKRAAVALGAAAVILVPDEPWLVAFALGAAVLAWIVQALGSRKHMLITVLRGSAQIAAVTMLIWITVIGVGEIRHVLHPTLHDNAGDGVHVGAMAPPMEVMEAAPTQLAEPAAPAATQAMQQNDADIAKDLGDQKNVEASKPKMARPVPAMSTSYDSSGSFASPLSKRSSYGYDVDPNAVVQAGPGLPTWGGRVLSFGWDGTVSASTAAQLFVVGPFGTSVWGLLKIAALVCLMLWILPRRWALALPVALRARSFGLIACAFAVGLLGWATPAHAEMPSKEMLDELRERVTQKSKTASADAEEALVILRGDTLTLRMRVHATGAAAIGLPLVTPWTSSRISIDGKDGVALRGPGKLLSAAVDEGVHELVYEGTLSAGANSVEIAFGSASRPHHTAVEAKGWAVDGVAASGRTDELVRLSREVQASAAGATTMVSGPDTGWPSFRITRTLTMGLTWMLSTEVQRLAPGPAVRFKLPAFPGETPLSSDDIRLEEGVLAMTVPATGAVHWNSLLAAGPRHLSLRAAADGLAFETWKFVPGPQWDLVWKGMDANRFYKDVPYTFLPWPGQSLDVEVRALAGAPGAPLSIESSDLTIGPDGSGADVDLRLNIRATRGTTHVIELPEGAEGISVQKDGGAAGAPSASSVAGRKVHLVLSPGSSAYTIHFRLPRGWSVFWTSPSFDLGADSTNHRVTVNQVSQRWVLAAGGQGLTPVVLLLGILLGVVAVGWALSLYKAVPLTWAHWSLLLLGLLTNSLVGLLIVVGWFVATAHFARVHEFAQHWKRRLIYLAYAVLSIAVLGIGFATLSKTFVGYPESYIEGLGCSSYQLAWYVDRLPAAVRSVARVTSLPIWSYRLAMFVWALAMARLVVSWGKWVWSCVLPKEPPAGGGPANADAELPAVTVE